MAEKTPEEMREAVLAIREKMAAAAREAGRGPAEVQLCAACKTRTAETVAASAALSIDVFGENHVQELCANFDAGAYCGKPSHFIGHLQTNKIKKVLGRASLIQSVGSEHLLTAIEKEAAKAGIVQNVLLEVNIGGGAVSYTQLPAHETGRKTVFRPLLEKKKHTSTHSRHIDQLEHVTHQTQHATKAIRHV